MLNMTIGNLYKKVSGLVLACFMSSASMNAASAQEELNQIIDANTGHLRNFHEETVDRDGFIRSYPQYYYTNVPTSALVQWTDICNSLHAYETDPENPQLKANAIYAGRTLTMLMVSPERTFCVNRTLYDECKRKVTWMREHLSPMDFRRAFHVIHGETLAEINKTEVQEELNGIIDSNTRYLNNFHEGMIDRNGMIRCFPQYDYTNVPTSALVQWTDICNSLHAYEADPENPQLKANAIYAGRTLTMLMVSPERTFHVHRTLYDECVRKVTWMREHLSPMDFRKAFHVIHREALAEIG
ncbi:MAG: hypothetical protein LBQ43_02985 [Holosporales bacterium]|jgi:hypothetical protein|nr:hypothetical protein [Holosporales bacterium]